MLNYPTASTDSLQRQGSTGSALSSDEQQRQASVGDTRRPSAARSTDDYVAPPITLNTHVNDNAGYAAPPIVGADLVLNSQTINAAVHRGYDTVPIESKESISVVNSDNYNRSESFSNSEISEIENS